MEMEPENITTTTIQVKDHDEGQGQGQVNSTNNNVPEVPAEPEAEVEGFETAIFLSADFICRFTLVQFGPDDKYDNSELRNDLIQYILRACGLVTRIIYITGNEETDGLSLCEGHYDSEYLYLLKESPPNRKRHQIDIPILTRSFSGDNLVDLNYLKVFQQKMKIDLFSSGFIYDCVRKNQVVDLSTYRVGESLFQDYDAQELFLLNPNEEKGWDSLVPKYVEPLKRKRPKKVNQNQNMSIEQMKKKKHDDELDSLLESLIEEVDFMTNFNGKGNDNNDDDKNEKEEQVKQVSPASITKNKSIYEPDDLEETTVLVPQIIKNPSPTVQIPQIIEDKNPSPTVQLPAIVEVNNPPPTVQLPAIVEVNNPPSLPPIDTRPVTSSVSESKDKSKSPKKKSILGGKKTALNRRVKPIFDYISDNESESSTTDNELSDLDANFSADKSLDKEKDNELIKANNKKSRTFRRDDISPPQSPIQQTNAAGNPPLSPIRDNQPNQNQHANNPNPNVDYVIAGPSTGRTRVGGNTGGPIAQLYRQKKPKLAFTYNESQALVDFICKNKHYSGVKGNAIWQSIHHSAADPLPNRSWQSKRENFVRKVMKNLEDYVMSDQDRAAFKRSYPKKKKRTGTGTEIEINPSKCPFTHEESQKLVKYICDNNLHSFVNGNTIWKDIRPEDDPLPQRTWQSKRENFVKKVMKNLDDYDMAIGDLDLFQEALEHGKEQKRKKLLKQNQSN